MGGEAMSTAHGSAAASKNVVNLDSAALTAANLHDSRFGDFFIFGNEALKYFGNTDEDIKLQNLLKKAGESIHVTGSTVIPMHIKNEDETVKVVDNMVNLSGTMDLSQANLYG